MKFTDRVVLVTGSSSGIGRAVAVAFAAQGAAVVVNYPSEREADAAHSVVNRIVAEGGNAAAICADVSSEVNVAALIAEAHRRFGRIDVLVNNAGIAAAGAVHEMPVSLWDRVIAVHLRGTFLMTRAVLPEMYARNSGRIINTASQLAYKGAPGFAAYTAAKGAMLSFTRSTALEIGPRNITINCVAPGATHTPILDDVPAAVLEDIRRAIPVGRIADVDDIVPTYLFLAADEARHYQGQCLSPNGGDVFL
ncbi:MAG: SDR family NAD(P)-dependent oxidoreductase [Steroidobacteraceae bacterium]